MYRLRTIAWLAGLLLAHVGLTAAGGRLPTPPLTPSDGLAAWVRTTPPDVAAFTLLRLVALAVTWYLLVLTVLALLGQIRHLRPLAAVGDRVAIPAARSLVHSMVGVGLSVTLASPAFAHGPAPTTTPSTPARAPAVVTMVVLDEPTTTNASVESTVRMTVIEEEPPPDGAPDPGSVVIDLTEPPPEDDGAQVSEPAPAPRAEGGTAGAPEPGSSLPTTPDEPGRPIDPTTPPVDEPPPPSAPSPGGPEPTVVRPVPPDATSPPTSPPGSVRMRVLDGASSSSEGGTGGVPATVDPSATGAHDPTSTPPPATPTAARTEPTDGPGDRGTEPGGSTAAPPDSAADSPAPSTSEAPSTDPADPAAARDAPPLPVPRAPEERTWTIAAGDHLWHVADATLAEHLGRPADVDTVARYHAAVIDLNRDRLRVPANPDLVYPGQVFVLPPLPADAA